MQNVVSTSSTLKTKKWAAAVGNYRVFEIVMSDSFTPCV